MSSLEIRPTHEGDVPGILSLIGGVFAEYGLVLDAENEETHLLAPGPYFHERGGEFWVLEDCGEVKATAAISLHPDAGELRCLYVHRSLRGQGLGRRLTELAMDFARNAGKPRMFLWTDTRFADAHRLYERLGFVRGGERPLNDCNHSTEYYYERLI